MDFINNYIFGVNKTYRVLENYNADRKKKRKGKKKSGRDEIGRRKNRVFVSTLSRYVRLYDGR